MLQQAEPQGVPDLLDQLEVGGDTRKTGSSWNSIMHLASLSPLARTREGGPVAAEAAGIQGKPDS
jgi:hypothetical protein